MRPRSRSSRAVSPPSRRTPLLLTSQLQDFNRSGEYQDDRDDARELALLLAEEEAAMGDYGRALQALDAAEMLTDGVVPPEWAQRRAQWTGARRVAEMA
jgi:hypothetical protein